MVAIRSVAFFLKRSFSFARSFRNAALGAAPIAPTAMAKRVELALEAPESLRMHMNRMALHSIVQNLVDNALRYGMTDGQDGRKDGHIVVSPHPEAESIVLRVADDGPGIRPAEPSKAAI